VIRSLEINVFPWLGSIPVKDIEAFQVLLTLQRVADRGAEATARRIKTLVSAPIFFVFENQFENIIQVNPL
jgi:hypothetical protein